MKKLCDFDKCNKSASWGFKFYEPMYCVEHGKINNAKPQHLICKCGSARPSFGYKDDKRPSCCKKCKEDIMVDIINHLCIESNCNIQARFSGKDDKKPLYCNTHKKQHMIRFYKNKTCLKCNITPAYGYNGKKDYCSEHKLPDMSDNSHKKCIYYNCNIRASYGYKDGELQYCNTHKKMDMIKKYKKTCLEEKCDTEPSYGYTDGVRLYCNQHKKDSMICIDERKCKHDNCNIRPIFGTDYNKEPEYCYKHKLENMFDITRKKCAKDDCINFGYYGINKTNLYCKLHKTSDMLHMRVKRCIDDNCNKVASFGYENGKADYCLIHKKDTMINVTAKYMMCPECPLNQRGNSKYDMYCTDCFIIKFPLDERCKLIRKKSDEILVREYLKSTYPTYNFIHDTPLWTHNCECQSRRRIDLRVNIGNTILAVEVDEKQHKYRDTHDEEIRYDDVYMIYSGKWIFIRYNPDSYNNDRGIHSNPDRIKRLALLKDVIDIHIKRITNDENKELVEIHKLFYNGFKMIT